MRPTGHAERKTSWRTLVRWPVFLLANITFLFVIGVSTAREVYRGWTVDREIHALEAQAASLEGRRMQLETLTHELVSADRVEYEARARLGKKKPGERVIVLEGIATSGTWSNGESEAGQDVEDSDKNMPHVPVSNPELWWNYFFSSKR